MPDETNTLSRRSIIRQTSLIAGGLAIGVGTVSGKTVVNEDECGGCLEVCWIDVKPNSCPNSVNAGQQGTLPVTAGWPNFDLETVELIPIDTGYDSAFDECQDWSDPTYHDDVDTALELCKLATASERSASPTWYRTEDVDEDGDLDSKFRFDVADLDLKADDTHLILRGESTDGDCTYFGIDSVRVVGGGKNGKSDGDRSRVLFRGL